MIEEQSNYYLRLPDKIKNRLDFRFNHPFFDKSLKFINENGTKICDDNLIKFIGNGSTPSVLPDEDTSISQKVLFIKNENVKPLELDLQNQYYILRTDFIKSHKNLHVAKNDILLSMTGTLGNACLIREDIEATINQNIVILRFNLDKFDTEYIVRFLNSSFIKLQIMQNFTSGQTPYLNEDKIRNLRVIVLPKLVQQEILRGISDIELQAKKFELKAHEYLFNAEKILLEELGINFIDDKISYFFKNGKEDNSNYYYRFFEDTENRFHYLFKHPKFEIFNLIEKKYQMVELKNICREPIHRGEQPEYSDLGIIVIKTVDLKNCYIDYENTLKTTKDFFKSKPQAHIKKDDILVSSTGYVSLGKIDIFDINEAALADGHISIIRLKEKYDQYFVAFFLRCPLGQLQFEKWFTGSSGQIEVQPSDLEKFKIPDISSTKQRDISKKIKNQVEKFISYKQQAEKKLEEAKNTFEKLIKSRL